MSGEVDGPGQGRAVSVRAGNNQSTKAGRPFSAQLSAAVSDSAGRPVAGAAVTFRVVSGPATFGRRIRAATAITAANGLAVSAVLLAGALPGAVRITAATNLASRPATYTLRVIPGP